MKKAVKRVGKKSYAAAALKEAKIDLTAALRRRDAAREILSSENIAIPALQATIAALERQMGIPASVPAPAAPRPALEPGEMPPVLEVPEGAGVVFADPGTAPTPKFNVLDAPGMQEDGGWK